MTRRFSPDSERLSANGGKTEAIVAEIRRWIITQNLAPGERLMQERDLVEMFGASRGSVREALKALQHQGLVRIRPGAGGGVEVASMSYERTSAVLRNYFYFEDMTWSQIYELRHQLEPPLARTVAGTLGEDDLEALEETIRCCEENAGSGGDLMALRRAEIDFHAILARASRNPLTRFVCRFLNDLMRELTVTRNIVDPGGEHFTSGNIAAHRRLLGALRAGDGETAASIMTAHIEEADCFICAREGEVDPRVLL